MSTRTTSSLWRHRDFMRLWSAETISQLGTQVTMLALPLAALLGLKATPFQVGALTAVEFAPFLLVGLPAGVWVDRLPRRPILVAGDVGRAVALGSIPMAAWLDGLTLAHLYVAAFVTGVCTVFFDVAYQSYLPALVDREQLVDGNAKLEISRSGAYLAGPGLGGLLVEWLTAPVAILVDALSYLVSGLFVVSIRTREHRPAPAREHHGSMRHEMRAGLGYVLRHPLLRPIAACTAIANLFFAMATAVLIVFAVRELGLSAGTIGMALAIGNAGFLGGAIVAPRLASRLGTGRTIIATAGTFGLTALAYPLATPSTAVPILIGAGLVGGTMNVAYNVTQVSLRQSITPDRMLGRMNATMRFVVWGTLPIGSVIGGALADQVGLRPTLWAAAVGATLAVVPPLLSPVRSLREIPSEGAVEASAGL